MIQLNIIDIIGTKQQTPADKGGEGTPKPPAGPEKVVDGFSRRRAENKQGEYRGEGVSGEEEPLFI